MKQYIQSSKQDELVSKHEVLHLLDKYYNHNQKKYNDAMSKSTAKDAAIYRNIMIAVADIEEDIINM